LLTCPPEGRRSAALCVGVPVAVLATRHDCVPSHPQPSPSGGESTQTEATTTGDVTLQDCVPSQPQPSPSGAESMQTDDVVSIVPEPSIRHDLVPSHPQPSPSGGESIQAEAVNGVVETRQDASPSQPQPSPSVSMQFWAIAVFAAVMSSSAPKYRESMVLVFSDLLCHDNIPVSDHFQQP